jgi:hypothetical protein
MAADSLAGALEEEWEGARDPSTIRKLLSGLQEYGPPSNSKQSSLVPVLAGIVDDCEDFAEFTQYLAVSQMYVMRVASSTAISAFEECLPRTSRALPRLASAVSLVILEHVQEALPVVEEYAQEGWRPPDSLETLGLRDDANPFVAFLGRTGERLRFSNSADEDSLNAYFARVLDYPAERDRMFAIEFLLRNGAAMDQALDAAQNVLEHRKPCVPGDIEYAEQLNLLYDLRHFGGERGKAIAAPYEE